MGTFVVYKDLAGSFRWRLESAAGDLLAVSKSFDRRAGALSGVESCRAAVAGAPTEETAA
jgi:uncharacterized protein YegP (UPF0339 family)